MGPGNLTNGGLEDIVEVRQTEEQTQKVAAIMQPSSDFFVGFFFLKHQNKQKSDRATLLQLKQKVANTSIFSYITGVKVFIKFNFKKKLKGNHVTLNHTENLAFFLSEERNLSRASISVEKSIDIYKNQSILIKIN